MSNHTWSHLDAPYHLLGDGATFERLDPKHYLARRCRARGSDEHRSRAAGNGRRRELPHAGSTSPTCPRPSRTAKRCCSSPALPNCTRRGLSDARRRRRALSARHARRRGAPGGAASTASGRHRRAERRQARDSCRRPPYAAGTPAVAGVAPRDPDLRADASRLAGLAGSRAADGQSRSGRSAREGRMGRFPASTLMRPGRARPPHSPRSRPRFEAPGW